MFVISKIEEHGEYHLKCRSYPGPWLEMEGWGGVAIDFADRRAWFWVWLFLIHFLFLQPLPALAFIVVH